MPKAALNRRLKWARSTNPAANAISPIERPARRGLASSSRVREKPPVPDPRRYRRSVLLEERLEIAGRHAEPPGEGPCAEVAVGEPFVDRRLCPVEERGTRPARRRRHAPEPFAERGGDQRRGDARQTLRRLRIRRRHDRRDLPQAGEGERARLGRAVDGNRRIGLRPAEGMHDRPARHVQDELLEIPRQEKRIGPGAVVEGEVAGAELRLAPVLADRAGAVEIDADQHRLFMGLADAPFRAQHLVVAAPDPREIRRPRLRRGDLARERPVRQPFAFELDEGVADRVAPIGEAPGLGDVGGGVEDLHRHELRCALRSRTRFRAPPAKRPQRACGTILRVPGKDVQPPPKAGRRDMSTTKFKAACVQAAPVYMDLAGTVAKTVKLIEEAAGNGAKLVAFPECWIPGYPWFIWLGPPIWGLQFIPRYHENCLVGRQPRDGYHPPGGQARQHQRPPRLQRARRRQSLHGAGADRRRRRLVYARRKLKPTHVERTVFGEGDGSDFQVADTSVGRVGSLCCWEHFQPLSKYAMYSLHEQVHVASWPSFSLYRDIAYALGPEANLAASRMYALEGQCYVLASANVVSQEMFDMLCDTPDKAQLLNPHGGKPGGGFAMIFGPDGRELCEALPEDAEGILYADIDLAMISIAKAAADPVGHYSRPDVVRLMLNRKKSPRVQSFQIAPEEMEPPAAAEG